MTYTTTLKALREQDACVDGYNQLAYYLKGEPCQEQGTYLHFHYEAPISLATILESNGLDDALWALRAVERAPEFVRDCRLFAVACVRQVEHLLTDPRSRAALEVAERHARGLASDAELGAARDAARAAAWDAARNAAQGAAAWDAARAAARASAGTAAWAAEAAVGTAAWAAEAAADAHQKQLELFKQFFCKELLP